MITSSHFFNNSIFSAQEEDESEDPGMGPWQAHQRGRYATLDLHQRSLHKPQARTPAGESKFQPSQQRRQHSTVDSLKLELVRSDKQQPRAQYQKKAIEMLLPRINNMAKRAADRSELVASRLHGSPLAYELNFIIKKHHRKGQRTGYSIALQRDAGEPITVQKVNSYVLEQQYHKYGVYEKCVVALPPAKTKGTELRSQQY